MRSAALGGIDLLLEQIAKTGPGGRGRRIGAITLHRLGFFVHFLGLDRQRDGARLAIHTNEFRLDLIADVEHGTRIVDAIAAQLRGAQLSVDAVTQVDDRAAGIDFLDRALDDAALGILGHEGRKRILGELLDAERYAPVSYTHLT